MYTNPITNDPANPLVSVLIYNYDGRYLSQCLESVFTQTILENIEVVFIDDASVDGSWEIALEYAQRYPSIITMTRNKRSLGPERTKKISMHMANGRYYAFLSSDQAFLPEYVKQCVNALQADSYARFDLVKRKLKTIELPPSVQSKPLVSITVHNYNYGPYLRQCLSSVFSQTYTNIEVCFSDNASTDDSWCIAQEFALKYPERMYITRNRKNFGPNKNFLNCRLNVRGKYFLILCSDDSLAPECVERCVAAMEAYPESAFAMVHRAIIDEYDHRSEEPPFYNQTCLIPGPEQAAVYMMSSVNPSISQIMYRSNVALELFEVPYGVACNWYGNRYLDFDLCCKYPIVYIKDPLLLHRVHSRSDTSWVVENLIDVLGPYVLNHEFALMASPLNLPKVIERLPQALRKSSGICMRYCSRLIVEGNEAVALRYYHLAMALTAEITGDPNFRQIQEYWIANDVKKREIAKTLLCEDNLVTRSISYDPPPGSVPLEGG
jgi:glycosyltransferase involved in cell wall biosynthesis